MSLVSDQQEIIFETLLWFITDAGSASGKSVHKMLAVSNGLGNVSRSSVHHASSTIGERRIHANVYFAKSCLGHQHAL